MVSYECTNGVRENKKQTIRPTMSPVTDRLKRKDHFMTTSTANTTTPINRVIESDLQAHIEDGLQQPFLYTAIRNQRFVQLPWSELDSSEQRQIHINLFYLYNEIGS
jgi:hypothetical protein